MGTFSKFTPVKFFDMKRTLFLTLLALQIGFISAYSQDSAKKDKKSRKKTEKVEKTINKAELIEAEKKAEKPTFVSNLKVVHIKDSLFMLQGKGGNIGLYIGDQEAILIDSQFAEATPDILNTVSQLTLKPVKFLINTHFHGDHTGGNKNMSDAGITIFAQENVQKKFRDEFLKKQNDSINQLVESAVEKFTGNGVEREEAEGRAKETVRQIKFQPYEVEYPMLTFSEDLNFYFNNEKVMVFHVHKAHTDGDAMIYFTNSNVLHTGDAYVKDTYPFIDVANGGSVEGYIAGLEKILMVADEETKIIPGHGGLATLQDVKYTASMLKFLTSRITYHYADKKSLEAVLAMPELTKEFEDKGFGKGFIKREAFLKVLYEDVARKNKWRNGGPSDDND